MINKINKRSVESHEIGRDSGYFRENSAYFPVSGLIDVENFINSKLKLKQIKMLVLKTYFLALFLYKLNIFLLKTVPTKSFFASS